MKGGIDHEELEHLNVYGFIHPKLHPCRNDFDRGHASGQDGGGRGADDLHRRRSRGCCWHLDPSHDGNYDQTLTEGKGIVEFRDIFPLRRTEMVCGPT
jgi:hypothetical protein